MRTFALTALAVFALAAPAFAQSWNSRQWQTEQQQFELEQRQRDLESRQRYVEEEQRLYRWRQQQEERMRRDEDLLHSLPGQQRRLLDY